jgi:hypothetical protein
MNVGCVLRIGYSHLVVFDCFSIDNLNVQQLTRSHNLYKLLAKC